MPNPQPDSPPRTPSAALRDQIKTNRNELYENGRTVLFSHILGPITAHGSHLIYAPDDVAQQLTRGLSKMFKDGKISTLIANVRGRFNPGEIMSALRRNWVFAIVVVLALVAFKLEGPELKCGMQNVFMGWAEKNRSLGPLGRALSISLMMVLRLLVSNFLPFTSPAFAFLIARSQPLGEEWMGTFYLLFCSMPAGLVIPTLDKLAYFATGGPRKDPKQKGRGNDYEHCFIVTNFAAAMTDHLPFSFWVRPLFMEPAFHAVAHGANFSHASAAAAAVLAGHFMIWAGPATTMYQRLFVPDWITCFIIQPLGLFEDIAVVLATWAGASPYSQKDAELSLYGFMMVMNVLRFTSNRSRENMVQHLIGFVLTVAAFFVKWRTAVVVITTTTTTMLITTTTTPPLCQADHSNVKVMIMTVAKVSALAVCFRIIARIVTCIPPCNKSADGAEISNKLEEPMLTPIDA